MINYETESNINHQRQLGCQADGGGGNLFSVANEKELDRYFDTEGAITIDGDLLTDTFDASQKVVVVMGAVTQEGGSHE